MYRALRPAAAGPLLVLLVGGALGGGEVVSPPGHGGGGAEARGCGWVGAAGVVLRLPEELPRHVLVYASAGQAPQAALDVQLSAVEVGPQTRPGNHW